MEFHRILDFTGPLESTVDDFWRMILEQEVNCVVMLTNVIEDGEKTCEQYWPIKKGSKHFRNVEVTLIEEYAVSTFTLRKMSLRKDLQYKSAEKENSTFGIILRNIRKKNIRTVLPRSDSVSCFNNAVYLALCGIYWPMSDEQVQFGSYSITLTETRRASFGKVSRFLLRTNTENRVVKQYRCTIWPESSVIPTSTLPMLDLIRTVQDDKQEGPVIVHCLDGATKCGVYCTVAAAMQEMETDNKMNIPKVIQRFRQARPQIIQNLEQFRFCYDVMKVYLNMFVRHQKSEK